MTHAELLAALEDLDQGCVSVLQMLKDNEREINRLFRATLEDADSPIPIFILHYANDGVKANLNANFAVLGRVVWSLLKHLKETE